MANQKVCEVRQNWWERISSRLVYFVENIFFVLGVKVASNPWRTVGITWAFLILSAGGFLRFYHEKNPMKLWVPPESDFFVDTEWYIDKFGSAFRQQMMLVTAENVLEPEVLRQLSIFTERVQDLEVTLDNETYLLNDLCYKIPYITFSSQRKVRSANITHNNDFSFSDDWFSEDNSNSTSSVREFDPSVDLSPQAYCGIVNRFKVGCLQQNILDLWSFDSDVIKNLTKEDVINKLHASITSPTTGHLVNYTSLLGRVERDVLGTVIAAKSVLMIWYVHVNFSTVDINEVGNLIGTEDWVSKPALAWEKKFLDLMKKLSSNVTEMELYYQAGRSYGDISGETMFQEMDKLFIGIALMFIYIQIVMAGHSWQEVRLTLGSVGLLCVGMAYIAACSWCSLMGVPYGPVHASLPFLLMGLGIDDMFVMKACWEQLSENEVKKSLPFKVGLMLKHAGVSIVITSFTDIVAFLIGSITILPSLRSFCIYAAMGVFFIFCFTTTFYVAVFTLDIRRIQENRNGILFCYKHKSTFVPSEKKTLFQRGFSMFYEKFIFKNYMKALVILFTVAMTGYSIQGVLRLEQRFDPKWFIPEDTYYKQFLDHHESLYPDEGYLVSVFVGEIDYLVEFPKLYDMIQDIRNESSVYDFITWIEHYHKYVLINFEKDLLRFSLSRDEFDLYLSKFLFSSSGGRFQTNLHFSGDLVCGKEAPNITASSMQFKFIRFAGPSEYLPAMNRIKHIVKSTNITSGDGYLSVWSKIFANWVTDEIISVEVERNLELALICVMACTIILITNLQMCLWIFICVLLTLINVCGWMQRWGMTVDIVSCIGLELAIGLCVDYAAHVGHTYLTLSEGSRSERSLKTVTSIGAAVLYGGGSTLLSLSVLSISKAYTFSSFFKIFLLVIIFGLFHGLVFLPVVLSLIGPQAYHRNEDKKETAKGEEMEAIELNGKVPLNDEY